MLPSHGTRLIRYGNNNREIVKIDQRTLMDLSISQMTPRRTMMKVDMVSLLSLS
jgi:hypothetical protein